MALNRVGKVSPSNRSYGRGTDNYYSPARYAVFNAAGTVIGTLLGSDARYMETSTWTVYWLGPTGDPREVFSAKSFKAAKAWALAWDGLPPLRWRDRLTEA
jgi:hypothetical protein